MADHLGTAIAAGNPFCWTTGSTLSAFDQWNGNYITNPSAEIGNPPTGWQGITNCTIAQTSAQAVDGTYSCQVTATAGGQVVIRTPLSAFNRNANQYHEFGVQLRSATVGRVARARIIYFNSGGTALTSSPYSADVTTTTTGWVVPNRDANQVTNASITQVCLEIAIDGCAAAEVHYIDAAQIGIGKYGSDFFTSVPDTTRPSIPGPYRGGTNMTASYVGQQLRQYDVNNTPYSMLSSVDWTIEQVFATTDTGFNFFGGPYSHQMWQNIGYLWNSYIYLAPYNGLAGDTAGRIVIGNRNVGGDQGNSSPAVVVNDGNIHHVAMTMKGGDATQSYAWLDGIKYGPFTSYRGDTYADQNAFWSASGAYGWTGYNGYLGHHAQYARVLSDDELKNHAALALMPPPGRLTFYDQSAARYVSA